MDQALTIAIEIAFFALFGVALFRYLRHPTPLERDVLIVFASIAGLFATQFVAQIWPEHPVVVPQASAVLLLAEPYLVLRLIRHFERVDRRVELVVLAAFVASAVALVAGLAAANRALLLAVVAYFLVTSVVGSIYLVSAARRRAGASRSRLLIAASASTLLGLAILVGGAGSGSTTGTTPAILTTVSRLLALVAALAFLAAFAPPAFLRRFQQRAVAFELARSLVTAPTGTPSEVSWTRLADAAKRITGARAVAVALGRPRPVLRVAHGTWDAEATIGDAIPGLERQGGRSARVCAATESGVLELARTANASHVIEVPIGPDGEPMGWLLAFLSGSPLFVEDDLSLLTLLASLTARAIEREEAVSERTALVHELRRTNDELARASAAKSDFLAAMSHELRTPLNSIIGFSELMLAPVKRPDGLRPLDVADWAAHIHGAGLQLLDLINEVLDLARIEAGRLELRHERFDIAALLSRTVDAMRPIADRRGVILNLASHPTRPVAIDADPARVRQIVYNLLSNAIKFSPDDAVVDIAMEASEDEGVVRISIEDHGPGIGREDQLRLFEAFQQTARGRAQSEGTGLGLALARQLAERHGGRIELLSDLGSGSRFTLVLPFERPAERPDPAADPSRPLVLIVEDDRASAELLRAYLEPDGYRVAIATDGERGLDEMRRLRPSAVILDVVLPTIDGWEVMQRARAEPATRDVPILIVSMIDDAGLGLALGAVDFFAKPVDRSVLLLRLSRLLDAQADTAPSRRAGEPAAAVAATDGTARNAAESGRGLRRPSVLAVDDETGVLDLYRAMLEPNGYHVLTATSGAEGLRLARAHHPDAVILDLMMPDLDGFQVAAELRRDERTDAIPILVVTSRHLTEDDKARLNGHVSGILQKADGASDGLRRWLATNAALPPSLADADGTGRSRTANAAAGAPRTLARRR